MNVNKVFLGGNLTRDVETRDNGPAKFGLAVNESWTSKSGEKNEKTHFVDCVAWGKTGEIMAKFLKRGSPVFIEGKLEFSQWEANDGAKRSKLEVNVLTFQFIGGKRDEDDGGGGGGRRNQRRDRDDSPSDDDIPF